MLSTQQQQKIIGDLLKRAQNIFCSDCGSKSPCWASLDFGVFICMNCSGAHRALGPSITRVKSTKLDVWNKEWVECMKVGNSVLNQYWQAQISGVGKAAKPTINSSLNEIIKYVQEKYVKKRYVDRTESMDPLTKYRQGIPIGKVEKKADPIVEIPKEVQKPVQVQVAPKNVAPKQPQENLIDFDLSGGVKKNKSLDDRVFDQFQFLVTQEKKPIHSKGQYQTFSGTTTHQPQMNFDNLISFTQQEQSKPSQNTYSSINNQFQFAPSITPAHSNYFFAHTQNTNEHTPHNLFPMNNQYSHHNAHSLPSHQPPHQPPHVTMNINMNMYPKVMNINMPGSQVPASNDYLLSAKPEPAKPVNLNINLGGVTFGQESKETQQQGTSWVDQWK